MDCPNCGTANREGANFCKRCGYLLAETCPACGTMPPQDADFCDSCAFPLTIGARRAWPLPGHPGQAGHFVAPVSDSERELPRPEPAEHPEELSLEQFVPEELLQKLEAARSGGGMVGERRTVTMLFCDVKGPTAAAEQLGPTTRQISIDNLTLYHLCNSSQN